MTYLRQFRQRATMVALTVAALTTLAAVPLSQAADTGEGGGVSNPVDRKIHLGWDGLYSGGLRASSEYLDATSVKGSPLRVTGRTTAWRRNQTSGCATTTITIWSRTERLWTNHVSDCDGSQNTWSFDTMVTNGAGGTSRGPLTSFPYKIVRTVTYSGTDEANTTETAFF